MAHNTFRGEINSIQSQPTYKRPRFLQRWLNSLFSGAPFTMEPMLVNLRLSVDGQQAAHMGGIATSKNVQLYAGQNESSMFAPGNCVTVYGRQDMRGVILAQRIYNETTCSQLSFGISAWLVRLITLLLIGGLYLIIHSYNGTWGSFQLPQVSQDHLATICAVLLIALRVVCMSEFTAGGVLTGYPSLARNDEKDADDLPLDKLLRGLGKTTFCFTVLSMRENIATSVAKTLACWEKNGKTR